MTIHYAIRSLVSTLMSARTGLVVLCLLCVTACGESTDLKLEQARIALANDRADRALSLVDAVLSDDPTNREAMLIQASARISLGRLKPAKLTLDRLNKSQPGDPAVSGALLAWAINTLESKLDNPAFASTPEDVRVYDEARRVADEQVAFLFRQDPGSGEVGYSRALLHRSDLRRSGILIRHTRQMIEELGPDAPVDPSGPGVQTPPDDTEPTTTYAQQLEELESRRTATRETLLDDLKGLLADDPRHVQAAEMYLRMIARGRMWGRLMAQAEAFSEVTDLPVMIADLTVTVMLGMPEGEAPMADRIELGWLLLRATPADQAESETRRITSARLFLAADETEKVRPILSQLIEEGTSNPDAFYMYAQSLFAVGEYEKCREVMAQMFPAMDSVAAVQTLYGLTLWRLGEVAEARAALRAACQLDPNNRVAVDAFATLMVQQGLIGASGEDVDAFYQLDPTNPRAIQFKLQHAAASGDTQQVSALLGDLEAGGGHSVEVLGLLYYGSDLLGRHNAAHRWASDLVARQPDQLGAWMRLASTQLKQGDEAGLSETLAQIAERFPEAPGADQLTGELYLQANQYEHAVAALSAAVEEDADNTRARTALARALAALGRFKSALQQVQILLEVLPDDTEVLALGSRIAYADGQKDLADAYLDRVDPAQVDQAKNPALAAQVYLRSGDLDTASKICTDAISAGNLSPMLRLVLAGIYQERGETDRAEENLVALIRHYPNSTEAFVWLSQFYARSGLIDRGLQKLEELEVYNETLAVLSRAGLLRSGGRVDEAIGVLDPLLDKLIRERNPLAPTVADKVSELYKLSGDEETAMAVYDRLYAEQAQGTPALIRELVATWDSDSPARRMANLDAATARVSGEDTAVLIELSRRYAMLGRADQALSIVQRGLSQTPDDEVLLGVKAGVLVMLGRTSDAVDSYRRVLALSGEDDAVRVRYARALSADGQRPEAEDELMRLIRDGGPASLAARAALLETYQELGLHRRVATMVNAMLDKLPVGEDAALDRAIGKSLMEQGRYEEAQDRLHGIAEGSAYYPSAQVLYAQSEAEAGELQAAMGRVAGLMADPVMARRVAPVLLALDLTESNHRSLLVRADSETDVEAMPYDLALRWQALRLRLSDQQGEWRLAESTLERVARLDDADDSVTALRVVLMYRRGEVQEAVALLTQTPRLEGSATGSLLSFGLGTEPPASGRVHPMAKVLQALAASDTETLGAAVSGYTGVRTLFSDDVLASLNGGGVADEPWLASCKDLAMATVAMEGRMPGLAEALSGQAIDKSPENISAYALLSAAMIEKGDSVEGMSNRVRSAAPDSSITLMLDAMGRVSAGDHKGAITPLRDLVQRHPGNPYLAYQLAQELNAAGQGDEAIAVLTPIAEGDGPYRLAATNDLAYLLAGRGGSEVDQAVGLARSVLRALPESPAVMDTAGWVEHQRGRDKAALALMTRAIASLSDEPEAHYHLGAVYHALNQDRWARYHLEQAASGPDEARGVRQAGELLNEIGADPGVE